MMKWVTKHPRSIVGVLLTIMFLMAFFSSSGTVIFGGEQPGDSGIVDEIAHIPAGYTYLEYGDYRLNPEHPPLIKDLAALPLLFVDDITFPTDIGAWNEETNGQWESGWKFIYERGNDPEMMFLYTRFLPMLLLFLLGIYIYKWTKELFGVKAGLLATLLFAFSPNFIAHSRFVTTDFGVAVFLFISVYYFTKFIKKPGWGTLLGASLTFALASLAKFSAILLVPYFALLLLSAIIFRREQIKDFLGSKIFGGQVGKRIWIYILSGLLILIIGHAIITVPYLHHTSNMPDELHERLIDDSLPQDTGMANMSRGALHKIAELPGGKAFSTYLLGGVMVFARVGGGNSAFLLGDYQNEGWWYFYIVSFLLKVPLAFIIMTFSTVGVGFVALFKNWRHVKAGYQIQSATGEVVPSRGAKATSWFPRAWEKMSKLIWKRFDIFVIITVMAMFWVAGLRSKANIGLRWMLPTFPFLYVIVAGGILYCLRNLRKKAKVTGKRFALNFSVVITVGLLVWYVLSSVFAYPLYLSYFNELIGSKDQAYKYTVDSNLDWGQDLNRLAKWVEDNNIDHIYIDYFGGGVPSHSLGENRITAWHSKDGLPPVDSYLAVSATFYQMSEFFSRRQNEVSYVQMLDREPDYQIGNSILVYKITPDDIDQFVTAGKAIEIAAKYLEINPSDYNVEAVMQVVTKDDKNDFMEFSDKFQRPCYVVWFDMGDTRKAVYVDRLSEDVWGGYEVESSKVE